MKFFTFKLHALALAFALGFGINSMAQEPNKSAKPNIVIIMSDEVSPF